MRRKGTPLTRAIGRHEMGMSSGHRKGKSQPSPERGSIRIDHFKSEEPHDVEPPGFEGKGGKKNPSAIAEGTLGNSITQTSFAFRV